MEAYRRKPNPTGRRKRPNELPRRAGERAALYEQWALKTCELAGRPHCKVKILPKDTTEVLLSVTSELGQEMLRDLDKLTTEEVLRQAVTGLLEELPSRIRFPGPQPFTSR